MISKKNILLFLEIVLSSLKSDFDDTKIKQSFLANIDDNEDCANKFIAWLPKVKEELANDLDFFMQSDPAANSSLEVELTYPGYLAITYYRIAHSLVKLGYQTEARIISEAVHSLTGIDIHPGAQIASPFFIDHGTGIVIGETAVVGKHCKIYQGVTLGALSLSKGSALKGVKRHPTVGDDVTIYSGASILGDIKIGSNVTIGSNVFLLEDVPSNMKVSLSKPELIMKEKGERR